MIRDVLPIFKPVAPFLKAWNSLSCFPPPANGTKTKDRTEAGAPSQDASSSEKPQENQTNSGGPPNAVKGSKEKKRTGWFAKLRNMLTRRTKTNGKSADERRNLPHSPQSVRSRPKRTLSVYPPEGRDAKVKGQSKKRKGVPPSVAILMLSGARDEVVPPAHMRTLWDAAIASSGNESQIDNHDGTSRREVGFELPSRRGTTSSVGSTRSETSSSDHKAPQHEPESRRRSRTPDDHGQSSRVRTRLATFASFPQGNHVDTWDHPGYWGIVGGFLERCVGRSASLDTASSSTDIQIRLRRGREARGGGAREGTADSGIGIEIVLGDPRLDALRRDGRQPRKMQSWDEAAHRRRESWESLGMHRPTASGPMHASARVVGSTKARSRSSSPPSPSIMESLATASAWAAPEESPQAARFTVGD